MVGNEKKVQIYLSTFYVVDIASSDLRQIDNKTLKRDEFVKKLMPIEESEQATV